MNYFLATSLVMLVNFGHFAVKSQKSMCSFQDNDFNLSWQVDQWDNIHFNFRYDNFPHDDRWTGVAFGPHMEGGLDIIMIRLVKGNVIIEDHSVLGYVNSIPDRQNDVTVYGASYVDNILQASFSRPLKASDSSADRSIEYCTIWHFAASANVIDIEGYQRNHYITPVKKIVCVDYCRLNQDHSSSQIKDTERRPTPPSNEPQWGKNPSVDHQKTPEITQPTLTNTDTTNTDKVSRKIGVRGPPSHSGNDPVTRISLGRAVEAERAKCPGPDMSFCRGYIERYIKWFYDGADRQENLCTGLNIFHNKCCRSINAVCDA